MPDFLRWTFGFGHCPPHHFGGPSSYVEDETCQIPDSPLAYAMLGCGNTRWQSVSLGRDYLLNNDNEKLNLLN